MKPFPKPFPKFLAAFFLAVPAAHAVDFPAGVEVRDYTGWHDAIYLNATEIPVQAVVVPSVGGRIVHFSLEGENIFFENSASAGKMLGAIPTELWLGGYQLDLGPRTRDLGLHMNLLEGRESSEYKDFYVHVASEPDPALGVILEKSYVLAPDTGNLGLTQRFRNISDKEISYSLIDRTICKGGGFILIPLNKHSRFKAGWSQRRQSEGKAVYDGDTPNAIQAKVLDGVLVVSASGDVTQLGVDSTEGWMAYVRGKQLYVKYFPYDPQGTYSDGGNSVQVYFDQRAVELSPCSPEVKVAPGKDYMFPEKWSLTELSKEVTTWEEARKAVKKIKKSPFDEKWAKSKNH